MPEFQVVLTDRAVKDLESIPGKIQLQILQDVASLAAEPFPSRPGRKKLRGFRQPLYRLRAGDFRVLYRVEGKDVTVVRVIDRRDLDRALNAL